MKLSTHPNNCLPAVMALLGALILAGCVATSEQPSIPESIQHPPPGNLQLIEAMRQPKVHLGTTVRWGGSIITVHRNQQGNAEIEILERSLDDQGRPQDSGPSDGRFLIRAAADVDSNLYRQGSRITVAGTFQSMEPHQIGNKQQDLPLVEVRDYIQWADAYPPPHHFNDPYYWSPYYGRPYYRWPYFFPRFHIGINYSN